MQHDHHDSHGGPGGPCDKKGFMSYGSHLSAWSDCSRKNFLDYYNTKKSNWCLEGMLHLMKCKFFSSGLSLVVLQTYSIVNFSIVL